MSHYIGISLHRTGQPIKWFTRGFYFQAAKSDGMTPPSDVADGDSPRTDQLESARAWLDSADRAIISYMDWLAVPVLRVALGVVFIWFGGLKIIGGSPAADLVAATVYVVPPDLFVPILGVWEVLIGICLLYRPLIRLGILLLFLQMPGTFLPIVLLPSVVFETFPYGLTVEGQYIIKNLVIIGAALVVGGTVRTEDKRVTEDVRPSDSEP